jgi:ABC-2 type transport system ATP-binding protein
VALIRTEALTKRYGSVLAVDRLTVAIEPGVVGLVGANGAGKSTLLKMVLGLLLGLDVAGHGPEVRARVGYMPEHDCLPPDISATELVVHLAQMSGIPRTAARERTADALRHVGLYEERYRAIGGYSTGMRQRVKLAQALVHDPALVLLDEPTNGLDPAGRDEMLGLIRRIGTEFGISVVVASHLLGELERVCDHVVVVDAGRLLRSESTAAMTAASASIGVEVTARGADVAAALRTAGLDVTEAGALLDVALTDESTYDLVRDTVVQLGVGLVRLERRRHRMAELFATTGAADGDS